ncbi:aminotransferase class I/II-fold pyridoxal phosphate-dependent enzyme [Solihabitans fulvus]|uniref:aminotransferase class I/II-fold pyridoxal phosphate-dependent enzyme n=1 Tax=Solihabitans fulvus TaxID=1892852 RepID=UPI001661E038|nr:aminotransferase class I/II-fold pyridoxal phosphate-dependent enzyme [Solihabitans fulvus]
MTRLRELANSQQVSGPLSHRRQWVPGVVQVVSPGGVIDLAPGYLDPGLLPVDLLREAYADALAEYGSAALTYGENQGVLPLREQLARRAATDAHPCGPEHVLITSGTSVGLHLLAGTLGSPGDVVLTESASYDFGRRILTDRGLLPRPVPMDRHGVDPQALEEALLAERAAGRRVAFAYLIPTFQNPTGTLMPLDRRREVLAVAARHGLPIVEDDAYGELPLTDGVEAPPSLAALADYRDVVRLCSFSKTLAPGLRLGWLLGDPALVGGIAHNGLLTSGGGLNHVSSLMVSVLLADGRFDRHVSWLRGQLRDRRDALADALAAGPDGGFEFHRPDGGFFLWLRATGGTAEAAVVEAATLAGVQVAGGSRFGVSETAAIRLSYSFNSPDRLAGAGYRLAHALTG